VSESEPTLVFVHGFCLTMGTFHFQRADLTRRGEYRMVFYDQPGHGLSGQRATGDYTLEELAGTLKAVLDATVPDGPVVLIGHSMGGMTIMAFAEAHPEFIRERVRGVVFMSTSGGRLDEVRFGMPDLFARASHGVMPAIIGSGKVASGLVDGVRRTSTDLTWLLTRRYGFGGSQPSPTVVSYVTKMNSLTSTDVVMRYLRALSDHARYSALEALRHLSVLVITGDSDQLIPLSHSEEICRLLPDATLIVVPDSGHVPMLEAPDVVNAALRDYLNRL
jgi:pimeloyl-ACP methyl ester carboxylesterase